ncbi:unnamed protein product [Caenorhabditis sp. 36 PRJEB53466]|nr:unnamed protein product [Caenorhabditis sp. 36 PRJEB53466]
MNLQKVDNNRFAWSTLLDEAVNAYLAGHLIANSKVEITRFAAFVARTMQGHDFKPTSKNLANVFPQYMLDNHDRSKLADRLKTQMKKNESQNVMQLEAEFMSMARGLVTYGASFFDVDVFTKKGTGTGQGLVGVNDHGLHIIFKKEWTVKNFRFDEFAAIPRDSKTLEIDAQRVRDSVYILVSTQMKFLSGILQKFQKG